MAGRRPTNHGQDHETPSREDVFLAAVNRLRSGAVMAKYPLPDFWPQFVHSVNEQNEFLSWGALRRYQASLLDCGEFTVLSPFSGEPVTTLASAYGMAGQLAYYFADRVDFWLLTPAQQFKAGHPLVQVVTQNDSRRHFLFNNARQPDAISSQQISKLRNSSRRAANDHHESTTLVIGHENFAHHLWNELPALDAWISGAPAQAIAGLRVLPTAEPLGPLLEIFPRLAAARFSRSREKEVPVPLRVRVGSQVVTARIRRVVLDYFGRRNMSASAMSALAILRSGWPRLWLSVRLGSRTPDNQFDFLLAIVKAVASAYPDSVFAFDGFSFPVAFFEDERTQYVRDVFVERSKAASHFIEKTRNKAGLEIGPTLVSRMCDVSGLDLAEAVRLAGHCDYYVCHGGTLQHKIGWFHDVPGLIHAAPEGLPHFLKQAQQAEGAVIPDLLPAQLALATSGPKEVRGVQDIPRNRNYRVLDVVRAAETVLASMRDRLRQNA